MKSADDKSYILNAPIDGIVVTIKDVPDPVFAQETLGPGVAIEPLGDMLCAPAAGKVIQCADTSHAVTLELAPGVEILLHLGLDTVHLNGKGLEMLVREGDQVRAGTPLIRFDVDRVAQGATSLVTPIVSTGPKKFQVTALASGQIGSGTPFAELSPVVTEITDKTARAEAAETTVEEQLSLALENGLHARPASRLKAIGDKHHARIIIGHKGQEAETSHITALLNLGLMHGDRIKITITGPDAEKTAAEVKKLLETPEGVAAAVIQQPVNRQHDLAKGILYGVSASPGHGLGPLRRLTISLPEIAEQGKGHDMEKQDFLQALRRLQEILEQAVQSSGPGSEQADILAAHRALLHDDKLAQYAFDLIHTGKSAAFAWKASLDKSIASFATSVNPLIRERTGDLRDLQLRLINLLSAHLQKTNDIDPKLAGSIVVAEDLTPSQMIALANIKPAGICLAAGGATSHIAVLCRGAGIPCLVGLGNSILDQSLLKQQTAILDADKGMLELTPSDKRIREAEEQIRKYAQTEERTRAEAQKPSVSQDGRAIHVAANITSSMEAEHSLSMGADAIGLFRSEFLFLDRDDAPSAEEQKTQYQQAVDAMQGKPVVIRMLDIGADKQLSWLKISTCPNPALGIRGVRLIETCPDLLETQLRALLQVKAKALPDGKSALQIMIPMVSDVNDVIQVRTMMEKLVKEMKLKNRKDFLMPQLGIMIEVPSAALAADQLAEMVGFFSIGTNDLTQYSLAMDREEPKLSQRLDILHPALLHLVKLCCKAAKKHKCPVAVCGAAAGDDIAGLALAALGVTELSVEPQRIAAIKAGLRKTDLKAFGAEVEKACVRKDAAEVRKALGTYLKNKHVL